MTGISTHVLDAVRGTPAVGVRVELFTNGVEIASALTDTDGRVPELLPGPVDEGTYRLSFDTGTYFDTLGTRTFYPEVSISFAVADSGAHYHVPLLLSPFAYSTYRGS
ncbi:hydroxyisourate hydrolase [Rhodococcus sp. BP-252]|uniref:5-hydroxyisourate hydrolase n=1 Tax=Rhodococcoides kyotonense TaxID=398843 RepID=A0A177Y6W2_9NOCA|nr:MULTISPECIES: hydroxyisourate hydrolase [Rhodococcus]MBY6413816.1 hydroxyisourate hydrolase [Rhodococcus sp. BP-320]MBY6419236.1 hydroxyisourate hydrolase [Rhodococcus sp. BP-321]MBY6424113.1 hydroxyisourate hydrolase [Rhodococcus sp. BP-324]MBY6428611.1 hydroxyisourate hydrolase [Rhodococcus sp. BP-323]MBY6434363.1 hydroxyisourate hydrolase [Rhodococcus sp. BP-322]